MKQEQALERIKAIPFINFFRDGRFTSPVAVHAGLNILLPSHHTKPYKEVREMKEEESLELWKKILAEKVKTASSARKCLYALDKRDRKRRYKIVLVVEDIKGYYETGIPGMKTLEETKKAVALFNQEYFNVSKKEMQRIVTASMQMK